MALIETVIEKKTIAVLAADVAGYSRLMEVDEPGTFRSLLRHRDLLTECIGRHGGKVDNTAGDSVIAEFQTPVEAVECAIDFQEVAMPADEAEGAKRQMLFRIGIHVGDVFQMGSDIVGNDVNIAARIQTLAEPGEVIISGKVYDALCGNSQISCIDLGRRHVKNLSTAIHIFSAYRKDSQLLRKRRVSFATERPSIAVLPFVNLTGDSSQTYFVDGVVDAVIEALSRVRNFIVTSRASSFLYRDPEIDVRSIGQQLGVRYILEGSFNKSSDHVRVSARLNDAESGTIIWAEHFGGTVLDIFALQDEITNRTVGSIEIEVLSAEMRRSKGSRTDSYSAYDQTLRGISHFYEKSEEGSRAALEAFYHAMDLDPNYAPPYAYAAATLTLRWVQGWESDEAVPRESIHLAEAASVLGFDDPTALSLAGLSRAYFGYEPESSKLIIDSALSLNPSSAVGWYAMGLVQLTLGEHRPAASAIFRSLGLNPRDPGRYAYLTSLGLAEYLDANYDEAIKLADMALGMHPKYFPALRLKAASSGMAGRDAQQIVTRLLALDPAMSVSKSMRQMIRLIPADQALYREGLRQANLPE